MSYVKLIVSLLINHPREWAQNIYAKCHITGPSELKIKGRTFLDKVLKLCTASKLLHKRAHFEPKLWCFWNTGPLTITFLFHTASRTLAKHDTILSGFSWNNLIPQWCNKAQIFLGCFKCLLFCQNYSLFCLFVFYSYNCVRKLSHNESETACRRVSDNVKSSILDSK